MGRDEIPTFPPKVRSGPPIFFMVVMGVLSGMVGVILVFWLFPEFRQAKIPPGAQSVIINSPGTIVVEEGKRVNDIYEQALPVVVSIFRSRSEVKIGGRKIFPPENSVGLGVVVTTDGWFTTTRGTSLQVGDIVIIDNTDYTVTKVVKDSSTPYILGKVESSNRFSPVSFLEEDDMYLGMTLIASTATKKAIRTALVSENHAVGPSDFGVRSSDKLFFGLDVSNTASLPLGSPVFSLNGSLLGLFSRDSKGDTFVAPSFALRYFLNNTLSNATERATLGIRYIFIDSPENGKDVVLVYGGKNYTAVIPGSPASRAGLRSGDRIVSVDGEALTTPNGLFSIIATKVAGDSIDLIYERNGEEFKENIKL